MTASRRSETVSTGANVMVSETSRLAPGEKPAAICRVAEAKTDPSLSRDHRIRKGTSTVMKPVLMTVADTTTPEIRPPVAETVAFSTFVTDRTLDSESLSNAIGSLLQPADSIRTIR